MRYQGSIKKSLKSKNRGSHFFVALSFAEHCRDLSQAFGAFIDSNII